MTKSVLRSPSDSVLALVCLLKLIRAGVAVDLFHRRWNLMFGIGRTKFCWERYNIRSTCMCTR